jgi:Inner membrane protein YgaP-like, transmembrane domain
MNGLFRFLGSPMGRVVRIVAGLVLIAIGLLWIHGVVGWILAIIGLVPLGAGILDRCVFAPLFGLPFDGAQLRRTLNERDQA